MRGDELAPAGADIATLRAAARGFYNNDLTLRPESSLALGREVKFTSVGYEKSFSFSGNPDKLKLFAALRDSIHYGRKTGELPPDGHKKERNTKAYHYLEADVVLDGRPLVVEVVIREDNNGTLYYDHRPVAGLDRWGVSYKKPRRQSRPEDQSGGGTPGSLENGGPSCKQTILPSDEGDNLTIVAKPSILFLCFNTIEARYPH